MTSMRRLGTKVPWHHIFALPEHVVKFPLGFSLAEMTMKNVRYHELINRDASTDIEAHFRPTATGPLGERKLPMFGYAKAGIIG